MRQSNGLKLIDNLRAYISEVIAEHFVLLSVSCTSLSASLPPDLNAFLFLCREQVSTPVGPSVRNPVCWSVHCVLHFEKMLYDVTHLARVYLHAWQETDAPFFRTITEETSDYLMREMTDPDGGFYSTQDAHSEGEEGKFLVWTPDAIREVLDDEADAFMAAYGVTPGGNFEDKKILEFVSDLDQCPALRADPPPAGTLLAPSYPTASAVWRHHPGPAAP